MRKFIFFIATALTKIIPSCIALWTHLPQNKMTEDICKIQDTAVLRTGHF